MTALPLSALFNVLDVNCEDMVYVSETGVFCTFGEAMLPSKLQDMFPSGLQPVDVHCSCTELPSDIVDVPDITGEDGFTETYFR